MNQIKEEREEKDRNHSTQIFCDPNLTWTLKSNCQIITPKIKIQILIFLIRENSWTKRIPNNIKYIVILLAYPMYYIRKKWNTKTYKDSVN